MSADALVSIVALAGWLVLMLAVFRAHRLGARRAVKLGLIWLAIFAAVLLLFTLARR